MQAWTVLAAAIAIAFSPTFVVAQCLSLTAPDDHVVVPNMNPIAANAITVEAWFRLDPSISATLPTILSKRSATGNQGYALRLSNVGQSAGQYVPEFFVTVLGPPGAAQVIGPPIQLGANTHLAATFETGSGTARMYVNGALVATAGSGAGTFAITDSTGPATIGDGTWSQVYSERFEGALDAVRVWNTVRTPLEVERTRQVELTRGVGLVAAWNFDCTLEEFAGGNTAIPAMGMSGSGPPSATFADEFVQFAGALRMDGASQFVTVAHSPALVPTNLRIEAWIELDPNTTDRYPTIVRKNVNSAEAYTLRLRRLGSDYVPEFNLTTSRTQIHTALAAPIMPNRSTHVAGTFDGNMVRIYVDGNEVYAAPQPGALQDTGGPLVIGRGDPANSFGEQWRGRIDTVRIWNDASTRCQIAGGLFRELASGAGLVAAWNFDGGFGDDSGNGHHGTPSPDVGFDFEFESYAKSLKLIASDPGHVEVPHDPQLAPASLTVEAVFRMRENINLAATLVQKGSIADAPYALRIRRLAGTSIYLPQFQISTTSGVSTYNATTPVTPGRDHHLAGTFDGTAVKLYLDGVEVVSAVAAGSLVDLGGVLRIGRGDGTDPLGEQFDGEIDSVRVWRFARSAADIAATQDREIRRTPGLVASYGFDDSLVDESGNGHDGVGIGRLQYAAEIGDQVGTVCVATSYGAASSACATVPSVYASRPVEIGGRMSVGVIGAPAMAPGALWLSSAAVAAPLTFGGLDLWVDLASPLFFSLPVASDAGGQSALSLAIEPTTTLARTPLSFQYLFVDFTCSTPLKVATSNALELPRF